MANFEEGDTVFVQKAGTLMKGIVTSVRQDDGATEVETDDYTFHFNDKGFDKRTIRSSTCRLHPYSDEAYETWERGVLFEKIRNFHFSSLDTPELKQIVSLIEETELEQQKTVQRSHLKIVEDPEDDE